MGLDILARISDDLLKIHFCVDRTASVVTIHAKKDACGDYNVSLDRDALVKLMALIGHDIHIHEPEKIFSNVLNPILGDDK